MCPRLAAVVLLLAASACTKEKPRSPILWQALEPGLEYALVSEFGGHSGARFSVHLLRFDPTRWQQRIATPEQMGRRTSDIADFRRKLGGVAAINGGYFDPELRPLGLLVSGGRQLSRLRRVDHGVFTIAAGKPGLQHARRYKPPAGLDFAVECGPRLVVGGRPLSFKPGVARRTAIGHDRPGRVYWIVSTVAITLADLADLLARPALRGGLGLVAALNLDGGPSTSLDLHVGRTQASVRSSVQVPVAIVLGRQ